MIEVKSYKVGILETNCYLIKNLEPNSGIIIDPGGKSISLEKDISGINIEYIFLTHGHFDHILKTEKYKQMTNAKIVISEFEKEYIKDGKLNLSDSFYKRGIEKFEPDILIHDNDIIKFQNYNIRAMHTPGHTPGSICYAIDNILFSGDTLLKNNIGRTDLLNGNQQQIRHSLTKIYNLNKNYIIYPGHGDFTTLFEEKNKKTGL